MSNISSTNKIVENLAVWPTSEHIVPEPVSSGSKRVLINGLPPRVPIRILSEDEYQLLLAGFKEAGGKIQK